MKGASCSIDAHCAPAGRPQGRSGEPAGDPPGEHLANRELIGRPATLTFPLIFRRFAGRRESVAYGHNMDSKPVGGPARWGSPFGVLVVAVLAASLALPGFAGAAVTQSHVFGYTGAVETFTVPDGVRQIRVEMAGGHGQWTDRTNRGGAGGTVDATFAVSDGDVLDVYVGAYGGWAGSWGYGRGGSGGGSTAWGHDGKAGGSGSALLAVDESPLVVAGGGGGGGGDGSGGGYYGGRGGSGGSPALTGEPANHGGGDGGCGGCRGIDGDSGDGSDEDSGGGGGGGGYAGGAGGEGADGFREGGGGGGGGSSYVAASAQRVSFGLNEADGGYAGGSVRISWQPDVPDRIAVYAGSGGQRTGVGTFFPRALQARVTAADGDPVPGAPVRFEAPGAGATATFPGRHPAVTVSTDGNGVATAPPLTASLGVGAWSATATVLGTSDRTSLSMLNEAAATTLALSSSAQPSVVGQKLRFTAYVTAPPTAGAPQGTVGFTIDGIDRGARVALVAGVATSTEIADLAAGDHKVEATFAGATATYAPSETTRTQTVGPALASLDLTSSQNPTDAGQPLYYTAELSAVAPGAGTPDGEVAFSVDGAAVQTVGLVDGEARTTEPWVPLVAGHNEVLATYVPAGDASDPNDLPRFAATAAALDQAVGPGSTTTAVTSSAEPAVSGQVVTLTATVDGREVLAPAGTVTFALDGVDICRNVALALAGGRSRASCQVAGQRLAVGDHQVLARYSGDPAQSLQASSGALTQRVDRASAGIALLSQPDPTAFGQLVALSATVAAIEPGQGVPTGTVQFLVNGRELGVARHLDDRGRAQLALLGQLEAGPLVVTARYAGDHGFRPREASETHSVARAETTSALTASAEPSPPGEAVVFQTQLAVIAPAAGTPVGQVVFRVDGEPLGEPVDVGVTGVAVSAPANGLAPGPHHIVASYIGGQDFQPSEATIAHLVGRATAPPDLGGAPSGGSAPPAPCADAPLIAELRLAGARVHLVGLARPEQTGRPVAISANGRSVARTTVRAGGSFAASLPRARGPFWRETRYRVAIDGQRSRAKPLIRRLVVGHSRSPHRGGVRVRVRVASGSRHRVALAIGRRARCGMPGHRLRWFRTDGRGRASVMLPRPLAGEPPAVYQLWTPNRGAVSLPIVISALARRHGATS